MSRFESVRGLGPATAGRSRRIAIYPIRGAVMAMSDGSHARGCEFQRPYPVAASWGRSYIPSMALTRERKIERMLASDAEYDGRFLTGVLTTGIYCLPSCRARKPKPENVRFFRRPEAAEAAGLRACKRCKPLDFYRDHDPDRARVEDLTAKLRQEPQAFRNVGDLVTHCGVSSSKLNELVRKHYHTTPSAMLARHRIDWACRELAASDRAVAEIAYDAGFESLSVFNQSFRKRVRLSPRSYRMLGQRDAFEVELPAYFLADRILSYLGRDPASVTERVNDRTFTFATHVRGVPTSVSVELRQKIARCRIEGPEKIPAGAALTVHSQVRRLLGLVIDPRPFERRASGQANVARLIGTRKGLTIPQTGTVFDALVWVIAGQQVSLPVAFALRRRLARRIGFRLREGLHAPPRPEVVAELEDRDLHQLGWSRRKTEYLLGVARAIVEGSFEPTALAELSATEIERRLLAVRGFGPWSVHYLMMRAFGLVDCVPIGDAALTRNLQRFHDLPARPDARQTQRLMEPFAPHRSLATFHLWALQEALQ